MSEQNEMTSTSETKAAPLSEGLGLTSSGATAAPAPVKRAPAEPKMGWWWGTGRRKTAVARVRIKPGSGDMKIQVSKNKTKKIDEYFTEDRDRSDVLAPLRATNTLGKIDIVARLHGGGYMGQAGAMSLGLARALKDYDPALESALRDGGYLTRDAREVERKKYGQAGARRRFQFSKR
jgi:small subunit ribosomal protein S9